MCHLFSEENLKKIENKKDVNDIPKLVQELRQVYTLVQNQKFDRAQQFLQHSLPETSKYNTHKENMAHAGFLLEVALLGSIMSIEEWPPTWMLENLFGFSDWTVAFIIVSLIWLGMHLFIRWQLRKRRWADLYFDCLNRTSINWINKPPTSEELSPYVSSKEQGSTSLKIKIFFGNFLDFLSIWSPAKIFSDDDIDNYPTVIAENLKKQEGKKVIKAELIVTLSSWFIYFLIVFRMFYSKI